MSETRLIDIKELRFDEHNFNRHNDDGMQLLEKSIKENGFGRSVLLDKDNNIVGGNGVTGLEAQEWIAERPTGSWVATWAMA